MIGLPNMGRNIDGRTNMDALMADCFFLGVTFQKSALGSRRGPWEPCSI